MAEVTVEIPDDLAVMEGVLVVKGYKGDGGHFWRVFPVFDTPRWTQSDLCLRAHKKLEALMEARA